MEANSIDQLQRDLMSRSYFTAYPAVESMWKFLDASLYDMLAKAYFQQRDSVIRAEIVDLIGQSNHIDSENFLLSVAKSKAHYLVRYYAVRNLIEFGNMEWIPKSSAARKGNFCASLLCYAKCVFSEISFEEMQQEAVLKTVYPWDHWSWMTHLKNVPRIRKISQNPPSL